MITQDEYTALSARPKLGYIFATNGKEYTPDGIVKDKPTDTLSNEELDHWTEYAILSEGSSTFAAYISEPGYRAPVTLCGGLRIGYVIAHESHRRVGPRYGEPFTMTHVYVRLTNGALYHGTYKSSDRDLVFLHRCAPNGTAARLYRGR